jgi:predicted dehydrogenase
MTHTISRRSFLRAGGGLLAGAIAAPAILPGGLLASESKAAPADRIGIAYIGCGRRSEGLRNLPKEGQVIAAADPFLPRAEAAVKKGGGKAFGDYRKLLEMKEVQAVIIASPDHWHALHAIHACQAGKDVYVEKPMTLTILEGRRMVQAARRHGRIVQCGSQQRSMSANILACKLIREGRIGKINTVIGANFPSPWECRLPAEPIPPGLDWDAWCGPVDPVPFHKDIFTPRANPGWISFRPFSGGEMTGWGAHGLDQVQCALGTDATGPVEVWTEGERFSAPTFTEPGPREKGEAITSKPKVLFRYASGVVLRLENGPGGGAIFIGEKGKMTVDRGKFSTDPADLAPEAKEQARRGGQDFHLKDWFECMKSRKTPAADVEIGHRSTTVCHLGNIARWLGKKLRWDPEKEEFPGDAEANALLDRPRRRGYELPA